MGWCVTPRVAVVLAAIFMVASTACYTLATALPNWDYECSRSDTIPDNSGGVQTGRLCRKVGLWELCVRDDAPNPAPWTEQRDGGNVADNNGIEKRVFECLDVETGEITSQNNLRNKWRTARGTSLLAFLLNTFATLTVALRSCIKVTRRVHNPLRYFFNVCTLLAAFFGVVTVTLWINISRDNEGSSNLNGLHDPPIVPDAFQELFQAEQKEGHYGWSFGLAIAGFIIGVLTVFWLEAHHIVDKEAIDKQREAEASKPNSAATAAAKPSPSAV